MFRHLVSLFGVYQRIAAAYREPNKTRGKQMMQAVIDCVATGLHLAGVVQHRWMARKYGFWEHTAPTVRPPPPPPHDYANVRRTAERVLPGVQWKQLLLWRYALIWRKPI